MLRPVRRGTETGRFMPSELVQGGSEGRNGHGAESAAETRAEPGAATESYSGTRPKEVSGDEEITRYYYLIS